MLLPENTEEEEVRRSEVKTAKLQFKTLFSNNQQWNKRQTKNNFQALHMNISISWYYLIYLVTSYFAESDSSEFIGD